MTKQPPALSGVGDGLERAVRAYEQALAANVAVGRHARPDEQAWDHVRELRIEVIRQGEALPRALWTREVCEHCRGEREVDTVHAQYSSADGGLEFTTSRQLCPRCWGAGLELNLSPPEGE